MKKYILLIVILNLLLSSCEKDEICLEDITPKLIIRFYDAENPKKFKNVTNLKVQINGIDEDYENVTIKALTDSISIPIKVTEDSTTFKLILNGNNQDPLDDNEDIFELKYTRNDEFVSRSCGYKTVFFDTSHQLETDTDNWIISMETATGQQNILNEISAHVKIFH